MLFLSQCLPYPPHTGVIARTYNIALQLQREFDVTLVAFSRRSHQPTAEDRRAAETALAARLGHVYPSAVLPSEQSLPARLLAHGRSVASRRAYTVFEYDSPVFAAGLRQALRERPPALIHVDSLDLAGWLAGLPAVPIACTHHNVESQLLLRRAAGHRSRLVGAYLQFQGQLLRRLEAEWCPRFPLNVMVSRLDAEELQRIAPGSTTMVAPNGVDVEHFRPAPPPAGGPPAIFFMGPLYVYQNRDAVDAFVRDSWPLVRARLPDAEFRVIGACPPELAAEYRKVPGVVPLGFVPDIRPVVAQAHASVVPIRVGGGTRLKILDAWAMGKPVVSTSAGCEGLEARDGQNIIVRDDPAALAEAVVRVLSEPDLAAALGAAGRRTAETTYSWDRIGEDLRAAYWRLLGREVTSR